MGVRRRHRRTLSHRLILSGRRSRKGGRPTGPRVASYPPIPILASRLQGSFSGVFFQQDTLVSLHCSMQ